MKTSSSVLSIEPSSRTEGFAFGLLALAAFSGVVSAFWGGSDYVRYVTYETSHPALIQVATSSAPNAVAASSRHLLATDR